MYDNEDVVKEIEKGKG